AVCGRGAAKCRDHRASGRAGRYQRRPWPQAARQDRPAGCPPPARAAGGWAAAGELDPAGARGGGPHADPTLPAADRGAPRLAAAVRIWAELGDPQRFSSSRHAVRHTGLDVTVYSSDGKRTPGRLARQGPPVLRWALFEAAKSAARASSPDHAYYQQVKDR